MLPFFYPFLQLALEFLSMCLQMFLEEVTPQRSQLQIFSYKF